MGKRKTHEEFCEEVYNKYGKEYTVLGKYIKSDIKILVRHNCDKCHNHEYMVLPHNLLKCKCPKCFGTPKKTTEQFKQEVYNLVGNEYTVLGEYKNSKTKILMRHNCKDCNNYEWEIVPNDFLGTKNKKGHRCPKCAGKITKTHEEFCKEVYDLVGNEYTVLGEYMDCRTKILMRHNCKSCNNHEYMVSPSNFLKNRRCPICAKRITGMKLNKSHNKFCKEIYDLYENEYQILSQYKNAKTKILVRHNNCGHEWDITPNNLLRGYGCPECDLKNRFGENSHNWKGGISPLNIFLRGFIIDWKNNSMKMCSYKCILTNENFNNIHHLYGFDQILQEIIAITKLPIYQEINKYTEEELKLLKKTCIKLHNEYGLGICLCESIHKLFHSTYGYGNNTPNQFKEFITRLEKGEFNDY